MTIAELAYVEIVATDPHQWESFAGDVLGMEARQAPGGALRIKMDDRPSRILVSSGPSDALVAVGWEVRSEAEFAAFLDRLRQLGVDFDHGSEAELDLRSVNGMVRFPDPSGNRHEVVWGTRTAFERFRSPQGVPRFVTGEQGMGHIVLPAPAFRETVRFVEEVLGFGLADILVHRPEGPDGAGQRIHFYHCDNPRHHSLALFEGEAPGGCIHLMIEVEAMDEVGRAYDRMLRSGTPLMASLGRHVNDGVTSFYMRSPAGFAIEFGYGGECMDWARHKVFESTAVSLWGHDFSIGFSNTSANDLASAA